MWAVRKKFPKIANPQICELTKFVRIANLPQMLQFAGLLFADQLFFAFCNFGNLRAEYFCELKKFFKSATK